MLDARAAQIDWIPGVMPIFRVAQEHMHSIEVRRILRHATLKRVSLQFWYSKCWIQLALGYVGVAGDTFHAKAVRA